MVLRARPHEGGHPWSRCDPPLIMTKRACIFRRKHKSGRTQRRIEWGGSRPESCDGSIGSRAQRAWPSAGVGHSTVVTPLHLRAGHGSMVIVINSTRNMGNAEVKMDDLGRGSHLLVVRWVDGVTGLRVWPPNRVTLDPNVTPPHRCRTLTDPFLQNLLFYHN